MKKLSKVDKHMVLTIVIFNLLLLGPKFPFYLLHKGTSDFLFNLYHIDLNTMNNSTKKITLSRKCFDILKKIIIEMFTDRYDSPSVYQEIRLLDTLTGIR